MTGVSGFGGGTMTPQQFGEVVAANRAEAEQRIEHARRVLGLGDAEAVIVEGPPGPALCDLAAQLGATVMVAGTRGRGGLKRAVHEPAGAGSESPRDGTETIVLGVVARVGGALRRRPGPAGRAAGQTVRGVDHPEARAAVGGRRSAPASDQGPGRARRGVPHG